MLSLSKARCRVVGTLSINSRDLARQNQGLSFEHFSDVEVKEVDVKNSLNNSSHNSNGVEEALGVVSVDPVENVKSAVHAQHKQVVTSDSFSFPGLWHHEELRENSASLKVDRESPENLSHSEGVVEDKSKDNTRSKEEFYTEGIVVAVVGWFELHEYQITSADAAWDVDNLHACVVERNETEEEIKIPSAEHHSKQSLRFAWDTCAWSSFPYLEQKDDNRNQMWQVTT